MEDFAVTLESLINRATDTRNSATDTGAAADFWNIINKEPHCAHIAARVIANKIQSPNEWEALQGLNLLDSCMKQCGSVFHAEVGKFRFLNEMIKLVSPKYLGNRTTAAVRRQVLQMMYAWTMDYSRETKIREAYEMLKKQGVIKEEPVYIPGEVDALPPVGPRSKNTIFEDDERSRLLQKLLQSKNPEDLMAANRLIKTMVKEDERRVEVNSRRITELESVHNNARLLSEMLDSYRPEYSSREELELIKELHQSCVRLKPNVLKLVSETQDNEAMLNEVISASDELDQVFDKYTTVIVLKKSVYASPTSNTTTTTSLLDLSTPSQENLPPVPTALLEHQLSNLGFGPSSPVDPPPRETSPAASPSAHQSNYDVLGDLFSSMEPTPVSPTSNAPAATPQSILQPVNVRREAKVAARDVVEVQEKNSKLRALDDLDSMGESLLLQSLTTSCKLGSHFTKPTTTKVPMNLMGKNPFPEPTDMISSPVRVAPPAAPGAKTSSSLDLDFLVGGVLRAASGAGSLNGDDSMVDLTDDVADARAGHKERNGNPATVANLPEMASPEPSKDALLQAEPRKKSVDSVVVKMNSNVGDSANSSTISTPVKKTEIKPLTDIFVSIDSIKPSTVPPLTALDERNGITVILHFAKDSPRSDVSVIVVTTISKNTSTLSNYLFQAVVPKTCKLRLLPPSSTDLPAHSPFLPPSAITQVMLIANPTKELVSLKFILSYLMDDETVTEMGEVEQLPVVS